MSTHNSSNLRRRSHPKSFSGDYDFTDDALRRNHKERRRPNTNKSRYSGSNGDEDQENVGKDVLPKWKMALVIGAICVCFALVFPTVFAPFINGLWGRQSVTSNVNGNGARRTPPMGGRSQPPSRGGAAMHPQMHMLQDGAGAEAIGSRGRGGMFTWMMPFYTIGIVAFLGYNLYKRMCEPGKQKKSRRYEESEDSDSDDATGELGGRKLRMVQRRLRKTDASMRQILEQLENIAEASGEVIKNTAGPPAENQPDSKNEINDPHLNEEQVKVVEQGLRKLRELSDLYKQQQQEIDDKYEDDDKNMYEEEAYVPSDIEDAQNGILTNPNYQSEEEVPSSINQNNKGSPGRESGVSEASNRKVSTNESYENIDAAELSLSEKFVEPLTTTRPDNRNESESGSQTHNDVKQRNGGHSSQVESTNDLPSDHKAKRPRRPRGRRRIKKD